LSLERPRWPGAGFRFLGLLHSTLPVLIGEISVMEIGTNENNLR
jgi:hypothetical protein